ncbi:Hypothetical predicted protein, partial [Marmota monax]
EQAKGHTLSCTILPLLHNFGSFASQPLLLLTVVLQQVPALCDSHRIPWPL